MGRFNDAAIAALRDSGYIRGETQANRRRLTRDLGQMYAEDPVVGESEEEISEKGITNAEARYRLIGAIEDPEAAAQLDALIAELTRAEGDVQQWVMSAVVPDDDEDEEDED